MKRGFYARLAWVGIQKNRKTYLPYLLACTGMVMMYYLVSFLSKNKTVALVRGGGTLQGILGLGTGVIAVFSVIFLFYTNSFLIRRRKTEFGLYNILGMGKWNLTRILLWENVAICAIALLGGLFFGILFSKLAELLLVKLMNGTANFTFTVALATVRNTILLFLGNFLLIFLNTFRQIHVSKPIELLHSETMGERPPKANWIVSTLGVIILAFAYYVAVSIKDPIATILWFFGAAIMVIIATYLLFIAGSVVLCKILQKNKNYYYKTRHFVSVSSMMYRMKRNGAGLASICILSTMVLVMLSSTVCLFVGTEDSLRGRFPRDLAIETNSLDEAQTDSIHQVVSNALKKHDLEPEQTIHYRYLNLTGVLQNDTILFDTDLMETLPMQNSGQLRETLIFSIDEYNRLTGLNETLEPNEVLVYSTDNKYTSKTIALQNENPRIIKKTVPQFTENHGSSNTILGTFILVVPDFEQMRISFNAFAKSYSTGKFSAEYDFYALNISGDEDLQIAMRDEISSSVRELKNTNPDYSTVYVESLADNRASFYAMNGGLLFLGVLLGVVFILAAVLIMYYKQISEGYEDQNRFEIMQKVGMTKLEIKKSINSQVLTVFFLPLLAAGIHVTFAFPMIAKLLLLFGLFDTTLLVIVTLACYLLFAMFYVLVYVITSRAYYDIVSGAA